MEHELDDLAATGSSTHASFFGVSIGSLISFGIVLSTISIEGPKVFAAFVGLLGLALVASVYFGIRWREDARLARNKLKAIKGELPSGGDR